MAFFRFRGMLTSLDPRSLAREHPDFSRLRQHLIQERGIDPRRADELLDNMLGRALSQFGDRFVAVKSALMDRVVSLRDKLDTRYKGMLEFSSNTAGTIKNIPGLLQDIQNMFNDLDIALNDLGRQLDQTSAPKPATVADPTITEINGITATSSNIPRRTVDVDQHLEPGSTQSRLQRKGFQEIPPNSGI